ncbi:ureidoglycolate lyase [Jannaschia sp. LMIT008]|uniref:ureidoglycolate lyase n=1 Tax=Jannaschia maritima TaxID=3032585 RepID=UPI00281171DA|nr:ureidoglycolate lyase [Jannaschia sp. LMIT008]
MVREVRARPMDEAAFAPFGTVLAAGRGAARSINAGLCTRWHDQARADVVDGAVSLSVFEAQPRTLPHDLDLIERHPLGSQAFLPLTGHPFLVVVSDGPEARPLAFVTSPGTGIQFYRGTWHGVLTPLHAPGLFAVVDRVGEGANLQEHRFDAPWRVTGA